MFHLLSRLPCRNGRCKFRAVNAAYYIALQRKRQARGLCGAGRCSRGADETASADCATRLFRTMERQRLWRSATTHILTCCAKAAAERERSCARLVPSWELFCTLQCPKTTARSAASLIQGPFFLLHPGALFFFRPRRKKKRGPYRSFFAKQSKFLKKFPPGAESRRAAPLQNPSAARQFPRPARENNKKQKRKPRAGIIDPQPGAFSYRAIRCRACARISCSPWGLLFSPPRGGRTWPALRR